MKPDKSVLIYKKAGMFFTEEQNLHYYNVGRAYVDIYVLGEDEPFIKEKIDGQYHVDNSGAGLNFGDWITSAYWRATWKYDKETLVACPRKDKSSVQELINPKIITRVVIRKVAPLYAVITITTKKFLGFKYKKETKLSEDYVSDLKE